MPSWQVDVCWSSVVVRVPVKTIFLPTLSKWPWLQEAWTFQLWIESRVVTEKIDLITEEIVLLNSIPYACACKAMVVMPVDDLFAKRTVGLRLKNRHTKPTLNHGPK